MPKIFLKTVQNFNILIQDNTGKYILTKALPYKGVEFPNEGMLNYITKNKILIENDVKLLRYKHKVSKRDSSLNVLATFWVKSQISVNEVKSIIKNDIIEGNDSQMKTYIDLIKENIFADQSIFDWEGSQVQLKLK